MYSPLKVLSCLAALVLASVVVASPAQAGGLQRFEPFAVPAVLDRSATAPVVASQIQELFGTPSFRTQRSAALQAPVLPSSCGLGVRFGLRF